MKRRTANLGLWTESIKRSCFKASFTLGAVRIGAQWAHLEKSILSSHKLVVFSFALKKFW